MPKPHTEKQSDVHVQIEDPIYVRKQILNTAINAAEILKHYEVIKEIKHRKKQYQEKLKEVFNEIQELRNKLEGDLPKVKEEVEHKPKHVPLMTPLPKEKIRGKIQKQREAHKSSVDRDIESIRRKLDLL
ncbi:MAG TPA: hypothetical protein VJJ53_02320 [Candidatus Nanoarchaeia archaeon]|nr:hypothetical protein [Candidatus Nanoarchaeia archaeon]